MVPALPPPEIIARLNGPHSVCVISFTYTDAESGNLTSAQCGTIRRIIARANHGDTARRINRCAVMLTIEGVRMPRLLHIDNCAGPLRVHDVGAVWAQQLLAEARVAPSRLDRVLYEPIARRPTCYKVSIAFELPGTANHVPLGGRSGVRCYREINRAG